MKKWVNLQNDLYYDNQKSYSVENDQVINKFVI